VSFSWWPLEVVAKQSDWVSRAGAGSFLGISVDQTRVGVADFYMERKKEMKNKKEKEGRRRWTWKNGEDKNRRQWKICMNKIKKIYFAAIRIVVGGW
jgi:hypothetical protein